MKTITTTIATLLLIVFSLSSNTFAAAKNDDGATTTLTGISNISKIEVHGNVQLYVTAGDNDKVKVYDSYYSQNALVQEQDGVLRISSYKSEKLIVWVTASQLTAIAAYDNASVDSFGKFSALEFALNLNNNATANFDMDCIDSKITVNDNARANIAGTASQSNIVVNQAATLNQSNFYSAQASQKRLAPVTVVKSDYDVIAFN